MRMTIPGSILIAVLTLVSAQAQVEAVWLTCRSTTPEKTVVNWKSVQPGNSRVFYGTDAACEMEAHSDDTGVLHHVEITTPQRGVKVFYHVETGTQKSETQAFVTCPEDGVRVAVVGDWGYANRPDLTALKADRPHILMTAGDNVASIICPQKPGDKGNIQPFLELIKSESAFFASTLFMPSLGNHDKQIRARGKKPSSDTAVYDIDAAAYLQMFALPDAGWKWAFTIPQADVTFLSLDMQHVTDFGTGWQTCHDYRTGSEQFRWYDEQTSKVASGFVVTLLNEKSTCRHLEKGAWHRMFSRGTLAITGFGYFAERAVEANAFPYYNTCIAKAGDIYRDPKSVVCEPVANYMLLTFDQSKSEMTVDLKRLDGSIIDRQVYPLRKIDRR